jgi:predicted nucleic acid-binding protein
MILVDANILLRLPEKSSPMHPAALGAIKAILRQNKTLAVIHQNLAEFYVVATRPVTSRGGLGFTASRALAFISRYKSMCRFLPDKPHHAEWEDLLKTFGTTGLPAHDARIVAHMKVQGVTEILSFNQRDFRRYNVTILDPHVVAGLPAPR